MIGVIEPLGDLIFKKIGLKKISNLND